VVVHEVGVMSSEALAALTDLLGTQPQVQVLATSTIPLYELVTDGRFPADLYYRLNVVTLTDDITLVDEPSDAPA
jgi:DNA-binding NtrC family response regulator